MKKFSFRLERLLKLKQRIEDQKRQSLATSQARIQLQEDKLRSIESERVKHDEAERAILTGSVDVNTLRSFSRYFHKLKGDERTGAQLIRVFETDVAKKSEDLVGASQEKRALEDYRGKLKARHDKEMEKAEQAELDDLATKRFVAASAAQNR